MHTTQKSIKTRLRSIYVRAKYYLTYQRSYSQYGEDMIVRAFYEAKPKYRGFYVDIGAHHPIRYSNTYHFYCRGWTGINIDATPGSMSSFNILRRRDINLELGIGGHEKTCTYYCFDEPALNCFDRDLAMKRDAETPFHLIKEIDVPTYTLKTVLKEHIDSGRQIDFLTVDVEGKDLEVLKSNDWSSYRPKFLIIEDFKYNPTGNSHSQIFPWLSDLGYQVVGMTYGSQVYRRVE